MDALAPNLSYYKLEAGGVDSMGAGLQNIAADLRGRKFTWNLYNKQAAIGAVRDKKCVGNSIDINSLRPRSRVGVLGEGKPERASMA